VHAGIGIRELVIRRQDCLDRAGAEDHGAGVIRDGIPKCVFDCDDEVIRRARCDGRRITGNEEGGRCRRAYLDCSRTGERARIRIRGGNGLAAGADERDAVCERTNSGIVRRERVIGW